MKRPTSCRQGQNNELAEPYCIVFAQLCSGVAQRGGQRGKEGRRPVDDGDDVVNVDVDEGQTRRHSVA